MTDVYNMVKTLAIYFTLLNQITMQEEIPSAAEFLDKGNFNNTTDMLIEFAKLHTEAALKAASEEATMSINYDDEAYKTSEEKGQTHVSAHDVERGGEYGYIQIESESILNAYPLENIK